VPLSRSLDHVGPMANSVEDVYLLLSGLCAMDADDTPPDRIIVPRGYFLEECDPRLVPMVSRLGSVETVDLGDVQEVWDANGKILLSEAAAVHEQRLRDHFDWFGPSVGPRLKAALEYRAVDYAKAREVQRDWISRLLRVLGDRTVLAVPATPVAATVIGDREGPALSRVMTRFTAPFNLAGLPVLSVPLGKLDGLPVGLQLVAGPGRESLLRAAARTLGF